MADHSLNRGAAGEVSRPPALSPHAPPATRFVNSWASIDFDLLRIAAALLVLLEHARNIFLVDYPQTVQHHSLLLIPYTLSSAGHQAVTLFFVLSGYFIGGTVLRAVQRDQWQWGDYLLRRIVRLWIVLIPTLLLCLFWDHLGIALGHAPALYSGQVDHHLLGNTTQLLAPHIFFANLFFLQGIVSPVLGTDGALWSLAFEFWYYLLFPLGLLALRKRTPLPQRAVCAVLFAVLAWFLRSAVLPSFPIWLSGVGLYLLPPPRFKPAAAARIRAVSTVVYFALLFLLAKVHLVSGTTSDYLLTVCTIAYLWLLLSHREPFPPTLRTVRLAREIARFSYTLYAAHTPILVFLASVILGDARWSSTFPHLTLTLLLILCALAYSYALAWLTEFRTDALRIRLELLLGIRPTPPLLPSNPLQNASSSV